MAEISKLGRYELRRILGKGAMGVVYEGFDPNLSRRVAVKTIRKSVALDPETERAYSTRFTQEAKAVARLNHPQIVQVYDFGMQEDVAYLVMEFIEGRELRSFFDAKDRFSSEEAVRIMGELLDALDFAHEMGVIHRDVKPANVMLDTRRRAKLADFGVARIQDSAQRSTADTMVGTPAFMSPEQIAGQRIDRRTDIFSAGTILYQLLTGEQPFKGEGAWTVAKAIMQDEPPPPSRVAPSLRSAFDVVVQKALAKSPAERFATAKEFSIALRGVLAGGPPAAVAKQPPRTDVKASDTDLEFWRSIQNRDDLEELELYVEQFPNGAYTHLARLKIAKLREAVDAARGQADRIVARAPEPVDADATVAIEHEIPAEAPVRFAAKRKSLAIPAVGAVVVAAAGVAAYLQFARVPAPPPVVEAPAVPKPPVVDVEKIRRETEERVRKEFAEKADEEKAALQKSLAEKAAAEKQAAEGLAAAKSAAEKDASAKALKKAQAEKIAADKAAREQAAAEAARLEALREERAVAARAAAEKAEVERAAAEKAAAEKAAAERAQQAKRLAAASTPGRLPPCSALPAGTAWTNCFGETTAAGGVKYVGEFRDGTYGGQGTVTLSSGEKYVGEFRGGTYNGQGAFTHASGERYVGEFRNGRSNGQGTYTFPNGERYVGGFRDGVYSGSGTYALPSGAKWTGEWRDGKRNGRGTEYRPDGTVLRTGIWENDRYARPL